MATRQRKRCWLPGLDVLRDLIRDHPGESGAAIARRYEGRTGRPIGRNTVIEYRKSFAADPTLGGLVPFDRPEPPVARSVPDEELLALEGAVIHFALKFGARRGRARESEEYADGWIGALEAARRYDPTRGAFDSFAVTYIKKRILYGKRCRRRTRAEREARVSPFSALGDDPDERLRFDLSLGSDFDWAAVDSRLLAEELVAGLPPRDRRFLERVVMLGWTQEEAGAAEDPPVERHVVRASVGRALSLLRALARPPPSGAG